MGIKACWSDDDLLPSVCVLDSADDGEIYGCVLARYKTVTDKLACPHWNEQLAVDLAKEILGDGFKVIANG